MPPQPAGPARTGSGPGAAPNVAVAFHESEIGGATRAVLRIVPLLEARGWRFSFWAPGEGALRSELLARGYSVRTPAPTAVQPRRAPQPRPGPRAASRRCRRLQCVRTWIATEAPDLVHANTRLTIPEAVLARRGGSATLLHVHEMLLPGPRSRAATELARRGVDVVVAVFAGPPATSSGKRIRALVVPNGVELPPPAAPRRQRRPLVVGTLGTVSRRKGTDVFLAVANRLRDGGVSLEFRIVGSAAVGPERASAEGILARARERGIEHRVVGDAFAELAGWDMFVLPSREDPFPLAVLEGMAAGLPVVATRVDGIAEQVTKQTGVLVGPDDSEALAGAIAALAADP